MWVLKMFGTAGWIMAFFWVYFAVMRHPLTEPLVMPLTAVDHWFAVREWALPLYGSLWVYVALGPALAGHGTELKAYCRAAGVMSVAGLLFFWVFPTTVPPFPIEWSDYPSLAFLKANDVSGNAFPSLHVSFAAFTAALIHQQLRAIGAPAALRWINLLWCAGIVYSTIATRQHVVADVLGGLVLAWVTWAIYLRCIPKGHVARQARQWRVRVAPGARAAR